MLESLKRLCCCDMTAMLRIRKIVKMFCATPRQLRKISGYWAFWAGVCCARRCATRGKRSSGSRFQGCWKSRCCGLSRRPECKGCRSAAGRRLRPGARRSARRAGGGPAGSACCFSHDQMWPPQDHINFDGRRGFEKA